MDWRKLKMNNKYGSKTIKANIAERLDNRCGLRSEHETQNRKC